ncbi:hypothetical protein MLD38_009475 [Melastoma candidum]|uniref:Uncharacterized protein n=1 Tax=Melastoma candidum TaxID=119954 RepID=A0ACB9RZK5_9MYRT|nr:hypothetical protein MLD38_009475 [Melastoma candidum]
MASQKTSSALNLVLLSVTLVMLAGFVGSDHAQDREECTDQLVGLATCLPYVNGDARVPTQDCCSSLKLILQKSLKCLCILVRDRNDPSLGIKVNTTLALSLPSSCNAPVNISSCIDILHLAPASDLAKVFSDFEKSLEKKTTTAGHAPSASANASTGGSNSPRTSSRITSDCKGRRQQFWSWRCPWGALLWISTSELLFLGL